MKKLVSVLLCLALLALGLTALTEGGWTCPSCGTENQANHNFCGHCGAPRDTSWTCPACGNVNTDNFCTNCGQPKPDADATGEAAELSAEELFKKGQAAYDEQDYETALKYLQHASDKGNANAQFYMGLMYRNGYGVEQDFARAVEYYSLAADQGNAGAQNNLGVMYYNGEGVVQDYEKAAEYFQLAAENGDQYAPKNLKKAQEKLATTPEPTVKPIPKSDFDLPDLRDYTDISLYKWEIAYDDSGYREAMYRGALEDLSDSWVQVWMDAFVDDFPFEQVHHFSREQKDHMIDYYYFRYTGDRSGVPPMTFNAINVPNGLEYHTCMWINRDYKNSKFVLGFAYVNTLTFAGHEPEPTAKPHSTTNNNGGGGNSYDSTGSQWPTPSSSDCPYCGGTGKRTCSTCNGTGYVEQRVTTPHYGGIGNGGGTSYERKTCPNMFCHGGKVDCSFCGGTGKR